ncbi:MAG TPA: CRTAC1 family protein, partial [Vicinamibacterales bacterium]
GITSRRWTLAVVAADLLGTGYTDLFFANDYGVSELYANQAGRRFADVAQATGVGRTPKSGMNASVGDVFNDGRPAIYKTNISEPGVLVQGNDLWVPDARRSAGEESPATFQNMASGLGIDLGGWSWGAQFGDLNNDGTQDLYLVNGYVSAGERSSYWYDFSVIAVGHSTIIGDAANWPAMRGRSLSGYQRKRVWLNDGLGTFTEVAQAVGVTDAYDGRAVALADFWNRGVLDVVVANQRGPLLVYRNTVDASRHWVGFELEGTSSNRSALGAYVELHWGGKVQRQDLVAASGFSAQNQRRLHFGLGTAVHVDRAVITWPSGRRETIVSPQVDTVHKVKEGRP